MSRLVNQMAEEVRHKPQCLVLFDEIEKAHEEALNVVLQIINGGGLSDAAGKVVDFRDTVVVVISNAESQSYRAEVVNGFDQFVVFKPLEKEHIEKILAMAIKEFVARALARSRVRVEVSERLKEWLLLVGYDKSLYGARGLKRAFATSVETKLADEILHGRVAHGDTVKLDATLTGDVECHISRQCSDFDSKLLVFTRRASKDSRGHNHTKFTIGGVDGELIIPLLQKHRLQHPRKKGHHGRSVLGVEADVVLRIIKSFL